MGRKKFICHTELPYHITARCINRDWFSVDTKEAWKIMTLHLHFMYLAYDVQIHAFTLMSNHFHLIAHAPKGNLSEAMRFFMSESSRDLRYLSHRINNTYGARFHRSLLNSPLYYLHAYKYLYRNPVEAGACQKVEDYPFSSLQGLLGKQKMEVPIFTDPHWSTAEGINGTLLWLNSAPQKEDWELVRRGLKKSVFQLAHKNNYRSHLEINAL
ncbi:MAG: transposase [Bdellovibrio sp.]